MAIITWGKTMILIKTPILDAIRHNDLVAVQTLISEGCNLKYQIDEEGLEDIPLRYAAELGRLEILELILASKTRFSKDVLTDSLIQSCLNGHTEVVILLIDTRAQINSSCGDYHTPLTAAVQGNHIKIVKALVEAGAKVDQINGGGVSPLLMAAIHGHQEIYDYLEPLTLSASKRKEAKKELLAKLSERNS
jgi:uncharacterized protein